MSKESQIAFAKWLQVNDPFLFQVAVTAANMKKEQQTGLGFLNLDWAAIAKSAVETVKNVAPSVIQYKAQAAALKTNLKRAEQGQPPVNFQDYMPTVKIAPEVTPETEQAINRIAAQSIQKTGNEAAKIMPWLIGGILVAVVLPKILRR